MPYIRNYLKAYLTDAQFREIINNKHFSDLSVYPGFGMQDFRALNGYREIVPEYVKDYVAINKFMN